MRFVSSHQEITFDDILLLPGKGNFTNSEEEQKINLKTEVASGLEIDVPIVSAPMPGITEDEMAISIARLGGLGFLHPFQSFEKQLSQVKRVKTQGLKVAASVSSLDDRGYKHICDMYESGLDLVSIETAMAHTTYTISFLKKLKKNFKKLPVSVSLTVDSRATEDLIKSGADSIRVGIGGGSHCTTRLVTGVGRPQLSAVADCYSVAKRYGIPIVSDTGVKYYGDIVKALAFGASTVMVGGLFSGTSQCPGPEFTKGGLKYKMSWGMCTDFAAKHTYPTGASRLTGLFRNLFFSNPNEKVFEEGVSGMVQAKGDVELIIRDMISACRRSFWYQGVRNIEEMRAKARVVLVSSSTNLENRPRI